MRAFDALDDVQWRTIVDSPHLRYEAGHENRYVVVMQVDSLVRPIGELHIKVARQM